MKIMLTVAFGVALGMLGLSAHAMAASTFSAPVVDVSATYVASGLSVRVVDTAGPDLTSGSRMVSRVMANPAVQLAPRKLSVSRAPSPIAVVATDNPFRAEDEVLDFRDGAFGSGQKKSLDLATFFLNGSDQPDLQQMPHRAVHGATRRASHPFSVRNTVEESADVHVENPATVDLHVLLPQRIERLVRRSSGAKAVRAITKVLLVDGFQHHDHRPLKNFIFKRRDSDGPRIPGTLSRGRQPIRYDFAFDGLSSAPAAFA